MLVTIHVAAIFGNWDICSVEEREHKENRELNMSEYDRSVLVNCSRFSFTPLVVTIWTRSHGVTTRLR